jgi:hypothetical protein
VDLDNTLHSRLIFVCAKFFLSKKKYFVSVLDGDDVVDFMPITNVAPVWCVIHLNLALLLLLLWN